MTNLDEIKRTAKSVVTEQIDRRTTELGNAVSVRVRILNTVSDSFRSQGQDVTASLVEVAADRLNRVAMYLTEADGDEIIADIQRVAGKQPLITAAAGLVLGVTVARVVKTGLMRSNRTNGETEADVETFYGVR